MRAVPVHPKTFSSMGFAASVGSMGCISPSYKRPVCRFEFSLVVRSGVTVIRHDSEYVGLFAEFYDMLHSDLSDVQTYVSWAQEYGPSVLELGSGTGRILLPMVRAGVEVTGPFFYNQAVSDVQALLAQRFACIDEDVEALREPISRAAR